MNVTFERLYGADELVLDEVLTLTAFEAVPVEPKVKVEFDTAYGADENVLKPPPALDELGELLDAVGLAAEVEFDNA